MSLNDMDEKRMELELELSTPSSETPPADTTHTTDPPAPRMEPPPDGGLKAWMTIAGTFVSPRGVWVGDPLYTPAADLLKKKGGLTAVHGLRTVRPVERVRSVPAALREQSAQE